VGGGKRPHSIEDKWEITENEPELLDVYDDILSLKLNYDIAFNILAGVLVELDLPYHETSIVFSRRRFDRCGECHTSSTKDKGKYRHRIRLYKGYYTLGVLLHEYAHAVVHQIHGYTVEPVHGYIFKMWFVLLVRAAKRLIQDDEYFAFLWGERVCYGKSYSE
jgi:hypothetical protein